MDTYLIPILSLLNAKNYFIKTGVPLKRCDYTGVTFKCDIEISYM